MCIRDRTEELIRRVRRAAIARQHIQVFKPAIDFRFGMDRVASHNGLAWDSEAVSGSQQVLQDLKPETTVVAIDEIQFFDAGIVEVCNQLAQRGLRVICAGSVSYTHLDLGLHPHRDASAALTAQRQ